MTHHWWRPFVTDEDLNSILQSPKFEIMFAILNECQKRSEKCLIFSTSVICLNIVEIFLKSANWTRDLHYFRLDGSTSNFQRTKLISEFNRAGNKNVKAFLISTKAGGQGINLTAANRIILLDTSWNPAIDRKFHILTWCRSWRSLSKFILQSKAFSERFVSANRKFVMYTGCCLWVRWRRKFIHVL